MFIHFLSSDPKVERKKKKKMERNIKKEKKMTMILNLEQKKENKSGTFEKGEKREKWKEKKKERWEEKKGYLSLQSSYPLLSVLSFLLLLLLFSSCPQKTREVALFLFGISFFVFR